MQSLYKEKTMNVSRNTLYFPTNIWNNCWFVSAFSWFFFSENSSGAPETFVSFKVVNKIYTGKLSRVESFARRKRKILGILSRK